MPRTEKKSIKSCVRKIRFETIEEASENRKGPDGAKRLRIYRCYFCDGYHLTHHKRKERTY